MKKASVYKTTGSICSVITAFFICLFLLVSQRCFALDNPAITHLGIGQGLSNNSVRCIFQDHQGFMWFGTYDGLNRYDGYGFKVFRNKLNDTTSLPHNYIYTIHEDQQKKLWIGTGQGLAIYNRLNSSFCPVYYYTHTEKRKRKISFNVNVLHSDAKGNVFIGTNGWGLIIRQAGQEIASQIPMKRNGEFLTGYNVETIVVDQSQRVWLFIKDFGLCEYTNGSINVVNDEIKDASALEIAPGGYIWIGSNNGLHKYSVAQKTIVQHISEGVGMLSSNAIASLCYDQKGNLWIGTEGGGINILNTSNGNVNYLLPGEGPKNLSSESIYALERDRENRMWIGTIKGGVNIMDIQKSRFETIVHNRLDKNSLINNFVSSFYEGNDKRIWIGTDGGGLSIWDRKQNKFHNYWHDASNPYSLSNNSVTSVLKDHRHNIWVATFGGGINRFNEATNRFEHFKCINDSTGIEDKNAWLLYEDKEKNLWVTKPGRY